MKSIKFYGHKNIIFQSLPDLRRNKNYSQQKLAAKMQLLGVGIDQQAISRIERDKRSVTDFELMCMCRILDITAECLSAEFFFKYLDEQIKNKVMIKIGRYQTF